jgi:hypothetical protein
MFMGVASIGCIKREAMGQKTLFDDAVTATQSPPRIARKSDPATSHKAAAEVNLNLAQVRFVNGLRLLPGSQGTAQEVAALVASLAEIRTETIRKRAKELVNAGVIADAGTRPCRITGKSATVYRLV